MKFPVFSQLAGNWPSETSSLVTASSSEESANFQYLSVGVISQRGRHDGSRRRPVLIENRGVSAVPSRQLGQIGFGLVSTRPHRQPGARRLPSTWFGSWVSMGAAPPWALFRVAKSKRLGCLGFETPIGTRCQNVRQETTPRAIRSGCTMTEKKSQ